MPTSAPRAPPAQEALTAKTVSLSPRTTEIREGTILGEYVIQALIAEGGMAMIYSAIHPIIGKKAAIKVMKATLKGDAHAVQSFRDEARDVNRIHHLNIVDVFAFGSLPDGRSYLVMEWLEGESLGNRLHGTRLTPTESCDILIQVCDALDAAHEKQVVHLDLKPDNVYLVPMARGRTLVKLLDFGIARILDDSTAKAPESEVVSGTPAYLSPEQAQGWVVDQRSDCYSFGVLAFEMLLGRRPFTAPSSSAMLALHISAPPPRPSLLWPRIPLILEALLLDLLHKDPRRRPTLATARSCLMTLRDAAAQDKTDPALLIPPPISHRGLGVTAIWMSAALLLCAGGWQFGRKTLHASANPPAPPASTLSVHVNAPLARLEIDGRLVAAEVPIVLAGAGPHTLVVSASAPAVCAIR